MNEPTLQEMIDHMQESVDMCNETIKTLRNDKHFTRVDEWMIKSTKEVLRMDSAILNELKALLNRDPLKFPPEKPAAIARPNLSFFDLEKQYRNGC